MPQRSRVILDRGAGHAIGLQAVDAAGGGVPAATLEPSDITAVRVCRASIPSLPATGALEVDAEHDDWFGAGWHLGERGGTQRFRWSQRTSTLVWRMEKPAPVRMLLRLRAANTNGATIQASINGAALPSCALPAGAWTDCKFDIAGNLDRDRGSIS